MTDFHDLLVKTSRTFALSIPLLEEPTRSQVTNAYLLFRIADTFEDAAVWDRARRIESLRLFAEMVEEPPDEESLRRSVRGWSESPPSAHDGYLELLAKTGDVLAQLDSFEPTAREIIARHTVRTCEGMAAFTARADRDGVLELSTLADLRDYCYVVAGIVGEMLTELFLLEDRCEPWSRELLRRRAPSFGEALQLVNILRDSAEDRQEGRSFLPDGTEREAVFAIARADLRTAQEYTQILRDANASSGTVAFTSLPVRLAWATLDEVERQGPGAKVERERVLEIFAEVRDFAAAAS